MKFLKCVKGLYIAFSAIFIILGICLIVWPEISAFAVCVAVGIACIITGAIKIMGYFSNDRYQLTFQFDLALGILAIVVGAALIIRFDNVLSLLPTIVGLFVLIDSMFRLQTAFDAKKFGMKQWWTILALAILSGVCGVMLVLHPFSAVKLVMQCMGISLTVNGIQNLCTAAYTVKVAKRAKNESNMIDVE